MEHIRTDNSFLTSEPYEDEELLNQCAKDIDEKLEKIPITIYGRKLYQPRLVGFFSDESTGYGYSKQVTYPKPLTKFLTILLLSINTKFNSKFNGILVNKYIDGNDYISAHSDDEKTISSTGVVTISYGSERKFRIREKLTKKIVLDMVMKSGDIICMQGKFQSEFTHEIPKQKKVKEPRYSFTFRQHVI